jgi:hypothetical protein
MRRHLVVVILLSSLCGSLVTVVIGRTLLPRDAAAHAPPLGEVRAAAFVLVNAEGAVLGRLGPGLQGNGNLSLYDQAGTLRAVVAGGGALNFYDEAGAIRVGIAAHFPQTGGPTLRLIDETGRARLLQERSADGSYRTTFLGPESDAPLLTLP